MLYPLKFTPTTREVVWGGSRLVAAGKKAPKGKNPDKIGESMEICPLVECESVAANGYLKSNTLSELIEVYMGELVGERTAPKSGP